MKLDNNNGWEKHQKLVEYRLNNNEENVNAINEKLDSVITTLATMQGAGKSRQLLFSVLVPALIAACVSVGACAIQLSP
jgi:hypothetical protein